MKIDVVGWQNRLNIGDEAFQYTIKQFFDNHQIEFHTPPKCPTEGDIAVLGGGAVVSPYYLKTLPTNKPKYALGVGIEYESEIDLLQDFQAVILRNITDLAAAQSKLKCPVSVLPDLAFMYESVKTVHTPRTIAILLSDYVNPALDRPAEKFAERSFSFHQNLAQVCDSLIEQGFRIVFIPCCTWGYADDRRVAMDIVAHMQHVDKGNRFMVKYEPQQMILGLSAYELTICMRFHGHIFSMIAGTPFVSIGTTRKVNLLLKENDLEELRGAWFEGDVFQTCDLERTIERTLQNADNYRNRFHAISEANRELLLQAIPQVRQSWLGESS